MGEAAAVEVGVIYLGFVFDLHCHRAPAHGRLEAHDSRALVQGVHKETCQPGGVLATPTTSPDPPARSLLALPKWEKNPTCGIFHT